MGYSVSIDREACISSGNCVADSPDAFDFDDDDIATVKEDGARAAARRPACPRGPRLPAGAIIVRDADGNEVDLFG